MSGGEFIIYMHTRIDYSRKDNIIPQTVIFFLICISSFLICADSAVSGPYLNSAHGSMSYGVNRSATATIGYTKGNCAHCHEQHASIGGAEPDPTGGPNKYALFYTNHVSQTDNFCFKCHVDISSYQSGGSLINRSYSYRAGGYADSLNDIKEAFSFVSPATSHNLGNIQTFINGRWGFTNDSNPCAACHNPHAAKGDPANSPNSSKSSGKRAYSPVSLPSLHSKDNNVWGLWGDASTERMSNYTPNYQAPYRYNTTAFLEPQGDSSLDPTVAAANTTDYVTFCTDCHNTTNIISSTTLGRNLKSIDWNNEKHGKGDADGSLCGDAPYPSGTSGLGKVLSCLDCHEPHGSPNAFLIRTEVNGNVLGGSIGSFSDTNWHYLCDRCHKDDKEIDSNCQEDHYKIIHHHTSGCNTEPPYSLTQCAFCHTNVGGPPPTDSCLRKEDKIICTNCHYHGSIRTDADYAPASRKTF
jgi:hypothetical protein